MNEDDVKRLLDAALAPALRSSFQEIRAYFSEQLTPITERLAEFEAVSPATAPEPEAKSKKGEASPELTALTNRLAQMEKQEADRQAELKQYKFGNELAGSISKYEPMHSDVVKELLANRYASKTIEKDGKYYTPSGTTLQEEVDGFFKSEVGSHFLKAPVTTATGTQKTNTTTAPRGDVSIDDMFADLSF